MLPPRCNALMPMGAGVIPIAHTPLAKGLASGIYTASNPTGGKMGSPKYNFKDLEPLSPIHGALANVSVRRRTALGDSRLSDGARCEHVDSLQSCPCEVLFAR